MLTWDRGIVVAFLVGAVDNRGSLRASRSKVHDIWVVVF